MRTIRFTILCDEEERKLITDLSRQLHRSQGDAIRIAIRIALQGLAGYSQQNPLDCLQAEVAKND